MFSWGVSFSLLLLNYLSWSLCLHVFTVTVKITDIRFPRILHRLLCEICSLIENIFGSRLSVIQIHNSDRCSLFSLGFWHRSSSWFLRSNVANSIILIERRIALLICDFCFFRATTNSSYCSLSIWERLILNRLSSLICIVVIQFIITKLIISFISKFRDSKISISVVVNYFCGFNCWLRKLLLLWHLLLLIPKSIFILKSFSLVFLSILLLKLRCWLHLIVIIIWNITFHLVDDTVSILLWLNRIY